ncbi:MAG: hypothetical protein ABSE47_11995 [Acidimicrobiales bacterium]
MDDSTVHAVPFQASDTALLPLLLTPTATQVVGVVHATPERRLFTRRDVIVQMSW